MTPRLIKVKTIYTNLLSSISSPVWSFLLLISLSFVGSQAATVYLPSPGTQVGSIAITSCTNTTPIVCTAPNHGLSNGAAVWIQGITGLTNADGFFTIGNVTTNTFTLQNILYFPSFVPSGNGTYGGHGVLTPLTAYTLNPHPRVFLDGANGSLTASLKNTGTSGKANSNNYTFQQLQNIYTNFAPNYTQYGIDAASGSSSGTGMQQYAASALYWFASGNSQALTVAKYGIDNIEQIFVNPLGFYCDETQNQCGRDHSAVMDWPSEDIATVAQAYSLIRSQLTASEISNFADKMLNDNAVIPNANSTRGNGFGGIAGDPTKSCTPWPYNATWNQSSHYCGFFWMEKHQDYAGVILPGQESHYATVDYVNNGFSETFPRAGNLEMTKSYSMIAMGLALADDDVRALSMLTQTYCYWYRWYYAYALSTWSGMSNLGARYIIYRGPYATSIALLMKNSIPGFDISAGNWLEKMIPMFVYTHPPGQNPDDNWGEAQSGPDQIDPTDYWEAYSALYMLFPNDTYAPYLRYIMENQSPWGTWNLWHFQEPTIFTYMGFDPGAPVNNPSGNLSTQFLFSDTDYGYCQSVFKQTAQPYDGGWDPDLDTSGCYPNRVYAGAVSKSDWTPSATQLMIQFGWNEGFDHSGCGDWGSLHIFRLGELLAGDEAEGNGNAHANTGVCGPALSDMLIQVGSSDSGWGATGYGTAARWAGTDPTGDAQSRYMYINEDLSNAYVYALQVQRAQRSVLHLKKSGTQDYVVVYDDFALGTANSIQALWFYWKQNSNQITHTANTIISTSSSNGSLATTVLGVNGPVALVDDGNATYTHKFHTCPSSSGATCLASTTSFEEILVHRPVASNSVSMPAISQPACTGSGGSCTVVDIQDATSPKVAVFARQGALLTGVSFTSTHSGTAQYVIAGLSPGSYTVTNNGASIGSSFTVNSGDNTLYFEGSAGNYNIVQTSTSGSGTNTGNTGSTGSGLGSDPPPSGGSQSGSVSCPSNTLCVGAGQQYATIQAAANAAVAGQTVLVMDGTYAGFQSVNSGTPSAPITFKANSSNVIINSAGDSNGDCINIENTDYVIVDGFTLSGCPRAGIRSALSTGVIIRNNVVSNSGMWGIFTGFTPQIQILNNKTSGTAGQHGIYVSNSDVANDNPVIRGNESWGNAQNGIQLNGDCTTPDPSGYTDGIISGALIEDNRVHDNGQKGFSLIGVQSSRIQNNIVYNNGLSGAAGGIHLAEQSGCNDPSSNNVIVNNTIVEPHIAGIRITTGTNNVLFNNIAVSSQPIVDESGGPNAIDSASNIQTSSSSGLFVNPASFDFHLASGSIAIGAGLASYSGQSAPTTDYDGNTRPQGSRWDSGAYEYVPPDDAGPAPSVGIPSGWVNIISKNSGKCLDIMGGPGATWPGDLAQQWDCWNGYNQQFQFTPVNGGYEITARHSGLQLDIEGGPSAVQDGVLLLQWPYWGGSNEIFSVNPTGDGYYTITVLSSGKCLDVSGMSLDNGALVHQWTCWGGDNQKWQIVPAVQ